MSNSSIYDDSLFGPAARARFDFTILFESTILSVLPSAIFLLLLPPRLLWLYRQPRKVTESILLSNKLLFLGAFSIMQLGLLILWATSSSTKSQATLAAAGLSTIVALGLCILSHAEHIRSIKPSVIINVYLLLTTVFDIARARTLWLEDDRKVASAFTSSLAIKVLIVVTEAMEKRDILLSQYQHQAPEATSGIYSRSFFWWLNTLLRTGFRKVLTNEDLYPIDEEMSSIALRDELWRVWSMTNKDRKHALLYATLWALRWPLLTCFLPRIALIAFKYAQPFLIQRTIEFVSSPDESDNIGWGLTAAFGIVLAGLGVTNGMYYHMIYRFVVALRGSLIGVIYTKTVDLSITALDESVAITLMATDTQTICLAFNEVNEVWAVFVEIALAFWLLQRQVGYAFVAVVFVALGGIAGTLTLAKFMGRAQERWIKAIQTRVDTTAAMLGAMKAVKMLGFTQNLTNMVQGLRVHELKLSKLFRRLVVIRVFLGNSLPNIGPLALFTVFVIIANSTGVQLNTANAYTSLSLITLVANPCNVLIWSIPQLVGALACFKRIQTFLKSDARRDHRILMDSDSPPIVYTPARGSDVELHDLNKSDGSPIGIAGSVAIEVQNGSFAWSEDATPAVNDATFKIYRQQFTFIIGPVGCGKSTLLKGILGETPSSKGFVYSSCPRAAYAEQTPWIRNGTVQQNILGLSSFEEPWYSTVVRACALEQDIALFPKGHASTVGSAGISLSGGQKQRLALARAVYSRKSLIILDDIFSGLDADTEEKVFNRLLGRQGLLRRSKTTVILVTHAVSRLPYADHIIAMGPNGSISEQGTFDQLLKSGGYVQSLETRHKAESAETEEDDKAPSPTPVLIKESETKAAEEELKRQVGDFAVYNYYFKSIGWLSTGFWLLATALFAISQGASQLLLTYWTSAIALHGNSVNTFYLGLYGLLTGLACIMLTVSAFHFLHSMIPKSAEQLHFYLLRTVMAAPLSFFTKTDTGVTTNRFSQDMSIVDLDLPYALIDLIFNVGECLVGMALMCLSAAYFASVLPPVMLMVWILQKYYLRTSRQLRILDLEAKSPLYSHFIESLSGLATIRAFGWANEFEERNLALLDFSQKPYYLLFCVQRWLALVLDIMVSGLAVILMILVVKLREEISAGFVGLALLNVMSFNTSLASVIKMWTMAETSIGAVSRLKTFSAETETENLPLERATVPEDWPSHGAIEFRDLCASYTETSDLVIRDLNLSIKPGEKIGICGRSGSGKSSLITTLFRMLEISPESSITVDGVDLTTVPREVVRSRLNAIPQEPFFMKGTVRYNADPDKLHTDAAIATALSKVHLLDLVLSKGGLSTPLDAEFFSHGQRQLFCLARAILRKSKIVVLDECTASVDVQSDELMQRVIREEFWDCTILAVAHRLDTILDFDRIVLLSEGRIVECDRPAKLLAGETRFRELYDS